MEQQILLWCVIAPAIISLAFVVLSIAATSRTVSSRVSPLARRCCGGDCTAFVQSSAQSLLVTIGWCLAVGVTLFARQSKSWTPDHAWPQEAWQQVLLPITIASLLLALIAKQSTRLAEVRWVVAGIAVTLVAMFAMPSGDGWSDILPAHRFWMGAIITSGLFNLWLLDRMARRGADRWVMWVALASLGCPAILAASAFAGLAEWLVAAIVATSVVAIAASVQKETAMWCVLYPVVLFSASGIAAGRFYTYEDHPIWLYGLMLFAPSVIALVDVPLERRSTVMRVAIALITSLLLLGCVAWFILAGSAEEQW